MEEADETEDAGVWRSIRFFVYVALGLTALGILFFAVA